MNSLIACVYRAIERYIKRGAPTAPKIGGAYALINVLHRIGTIASILHRVPDVFLSEFAEIRTSTRMTHYIIDSAFIAIFGGARGPDAIYPRSVDLMRNRKHCVSLRFVSTKDPLLEFLSSTGLTILFNFASGAPS